VIWITSALILCSISLAAYVVLTRWQLKRRRLRLRLLRGQNHLLSEQIDSRLEDLTDFDAARLAKAGADAEAGLNSLHIFLMDRQAHLQNYEDLLLLQRHKIAIQRRVPVTAASPVDPGDEVVRTSQLPEEPIEEPSHSATLGEHREKVEKGLIDTIKQLENDEATRRSDRRRR
jgi:hypothetical protein